MKRLIALVFAFVGIIGTSQAYAQEAGPAIGIVQLSIIPGGGVFFTEDKDASEPGVGALFGCDGHVLASVEGSERRRITSRGPLRSPCS